MGNLYDLDIKYILVAMEPLKPQKPGGNPNKTPTLLVFGLPIHDIFPPRMRPSCLAARSVNKAIGFEWRLVLLITLLHSILEKN